MSTLPKIISELDAELEKVSAFVPEGCEETDLSPEDAVPFVLPDVSELGTSPHKLETAPETSPKDVVASATEEARRLLNDAEKRSADVLEAAFEKAMIDFEAKVKEATEQNTAEMRTQFAQSVLYLDSLSADLTKTLTSELVDLTTSIAEKVVRAELKDRSELVMGILNNALTKVNEITIAQIHLNPEDLRFVEEHRDDIQFKGVFEFHEDKTIERGGCLIKTESGDIDARIDAQFEEIRNSLQNI